MTKEKRLYNLDRLNEIADGDNDFIIEVIGVFLVNVPANTKEMVDACQLKAWHGVYFMAHKIKASIDLFAIKVLQEDIRFITHNAKALTNTDLLEDKVNFVYKTIQQTVKQMQEDFNL